jgi:hypothetical protein
MKGGSFAMSKQRILGVVAALSACFLLGCAQGAIGPTMGIWSDVKGPITGTKMGSPKTGEACSKHWLAVVALGDASIEKAAANGGITRIDSVDFTMKNMIVFGQFCTIVRGS